MKNKTTQPYFEGENSTVSHEGKLYSVDALLKVAYSKKETETLLKDLIWVLAYSQPDEERVQKADISFPVIVLDEGSRMVVLDGLHRLTKAYRLGRTKIKSFILKPEDLPSDLNS